MISIEKLETLLRLFTFPDIVRESDQAHTDHGEALRADIRLELR